MVWIGVDWCGMICELVLMGVDWCEWVWLGVDWCELVLMGVDW